jgi:serine/threonine-protein kinase HipA
VPAVKYENEGGPGVADCARTIRRHSAAPARDLIAFLDALLFHFLIGNNDAHAKNYSLLLDGPDAIRLAPLYDLLCTAAIVGTSRKLAMRYGGEKRPEYIRRRHIDQLAMTLDVKPALVERRGLTMVERMAAAREDARLSLPKGLQGRAVLDRVLEVFKARSRRLRRALSETRPG